MEAGYPLLQGSVTMRKLEWLVATRTIWIVKRSLVKSFFGLL